MIQYVRRLVMKECNVTEVLRPEVMVIMFSPLQGLVDHHRPISMNSIIDDDVRNCIVVVTTNPTVFDTLAFG